MNITTGYEPKCQSCVDGYRCECHCQKSVFFGMDLDNIPWEDYLENEIKRLSEE